MMSEIASARSDEARRNWSESKPASSLLPSSFCLLPVQPGQAADQQFWHLWRQGRRPELRAFLAERKELTPSQVAAVIAIDQYERWLAGERVPAESYVALLPPGPRPDVEQAACDVIYGEYLLREQLGEAPTVEEYSRRFPAQAPLLSRQVGLHQALGTEGTKGSSSQRLRHPILAKGGAPTAYPAERPTIPGYEVLEEIGRGGMGIVYKARQVSLDRLVALKVLGSQLGRDPAALDRIRREAQVMARLSHPHIVAVHDAGQAGDLFYFAMEYVPGTDLHRLVEEVGPLPIWQACEYMRQAALGLQHAHEQGLVHRDIKPSNLIVSSISPVPGTGSGPKKTEEESKMTDPVSSSSLGPRHSKLKLLDLGLARLAQAPSSGPVTQVGAFMGTPDFIAPEQANDPRVADIRSDLYSLGCTFYYVLTGRAPFTGATPLAKLMQHHLETPPAPHELRPDLPPAVSALISRLMSKRPEDRFATPVELARALSRLQGGQTPSATPPTPPPAPRPKVPPRAGLVRQLPGHADWVKCVAYAPAGDTIGSAGLDGTLRLWQTGSFQEIWRVEGHTSAVLCLAFSPAGRWLVTGGQDRVLCLWDLRTRREHWRAAGHSDNINAVAFTGGGERILSASHDGTLRSWDTASGQQVRSWSAHDGPVWGVAVTADGRRALSGGQDRTIRLWNLDTGESLLSLPEQTMTVTCVGLTPDGRYALSGGMDTRVRLWDLTTHQEVHAFTGHTARVTSVAFSPDGRRVASGSRDRSVRIHDAGSGSELFSFTGHNHWVTAVAWNPAGNQVVSASVDRTLCVWDVPAE
jgi:WD40 repeat protein